MPELQAGAIAAILALGASTHSICKLSVLTLMSSISDMGIFSAIASLHSKFSLSDLALLLMHVLVNQVLHRRSRGAFACAAQPRALRHRGCERRLASRPRPRHGAFARTAPNPGTPLSAPPFSTKHRDSPSLSFSLNITGLCSISNSVYLRSRRALQAPASLFITIAIDTSHQVHALVCALFLSKLVSVFD